MPCYTHEIIELERKVKVLADAGREVKAAAMAVVASSDGSKDEKVKKANSLIDEMTECMRGLKGELEKISHPTF